MKFYLHCSVIFFKDFPVIKDKSDNNEKKRANCNIWFF